MQYPLLRKPYDSEVEYFKSNPDVAGMATEDDRVIFNPYSNVHPKHSDAIYKNEASRLYMKKSKNRPKFKLSDAQKKAFEGYGDEQDIRETIAARLLSGDESAGVASYDQLQYVDWLKNNMMQDNY